MNVSKINISQLGIKQNYSQLQNINVNKSQSQNQTKIQNNAYSSTPINFRYNAVIHFGSAEHEQKSSRVQEIDYEEYMSMTDYTKKRLRKSYLAYDNNVNKAELVDLKMPNLPLKTEKSMDEFIKTAKIYSQYKDQPIICLGRSPKWFLNAALWMKDGIDDYKFVAFSKYWHRPDSVEGMRRLPSLAPTMEEEVEYRKYLRRIKADPKSIVENMEKTGKKTVITDYIYSGKGVTSFLDVMSKYAEELGILEKFSKSIQIVGIGSMDYMEEMNPYAEYIPTPSVVMPERLRKYSKNIEQEFYNMDYRMFKEMLINQNTNECRSTYYPHETWRIYRPDQFKTGLVKDMKKVKQLLKEVKGEKKVIASFTPAMRDYRNLLNFRILDGLAVRDLLKPFHKSKI